MADIMIVDDEALVLFDLCMTVEDLGHTVVHDCTSVSEALECLEHSAPQAALLDIDVGGTAVWPLARALRARNCPICFVSANNKHAELRTEFADVEFVHKPASRLEIATALTNMLQPSRERV